MNVLLRNDVLRESDHPFLADLKYAFLTKQKGYLLMQFVRGGELFTHLKQVKNFTEESARFYVIQVAIALGHLHSKNVSHLDIRT